MRALLSKVLTGSMVAGAALLVAACGGGEDAEANNMMDANMAMDPMMDTTNDVTAVDGATMDANMMMNDANMMMDANMSNDMMMDNSMDENMTNGM